MKTKENLKEFFKDVFSIEENRATKADVKANIISATKLKGTNMCLLILAIMISCVGLNMDSSTVLIGAMLISPMLGGIIGIAYSLATGDFRFFRRAFVALLIEMAIALITSTIYFIISPISSPSEALNTYMRPSVWDVLIALAGGLAGGIGVTRKDKVTIWVGVAIATGFIPPLCTAGYGIATMSSVYLLGGFYAFFINALYICVSAVIVFKVMKMPKRKGETKAEEVSIKLNLILVSIITLIPSILIGYQIVTENLTENNFQKYLADKFNFSETQIVKSDVDFKNNELEVSLIGKILDKTQIARLTSELKNYHLEQMNLKITQTEFQAGVSKAEIEKIIQEQLNAKQKNTTTSSNISLDIEQIKIDIKQFNSKIADCNITNNKTVLDDNITNTQYLVTLTLYENLSTSEYDDLQNYIQNKLGTNTVITVSTTNT